MFNLVLFGPPGAGKGTHSSSIAKKISLTHLSTGDLLRKEIEKESELGLIAKNLIEKGEFVPDEVVVSMIENKLDESKDARGFIFDGFPRTTDQAKVLDMILAKRNEKVNGVIAIDVNEQELIERILIRGKEFGRVDDQEASVIQNRIQVYHKKTAPVKDYYISQNKLFEVSGTGCEITEVFSKIEKVLETIE